MKVGEGQNRTDGSARAEDAAAHRWRRRAKTMQECFGTHDIHSFLKEEQMQHQPLDAISCPYSSIRQKKYIHRHKHIFVFILTHTHQWENRKPKVKNFTVLWPQTLPKTTNPISRGLYLKPVNKSDLLITNQVQVQSLEND